MKKTPRNKPPGKKRSFSKSRSQSPNPHLPVTVKTGERFSAQVRDMASDGRGIVPHPSGITVFVPGVWQGESGEFRITGQHKTIATAELIELSDQSPARLQAPCPHQGFEPGQCGGCPWQFVDYEAQLKTKQDRVETATQFLKPKKLEAIWPSPDTFGYRNRAQFKTDGEQLGYVSHNSNQLAPIKDCLILSEKNRQTLRDLTGQLPQFDWEPKGKQPWTTIDIDETVSADNFSLDKRLPFQQSNTAQNEKIKTWLKDKLATQDKNQRVLELFCGSGNFTEVIADQKFEAIVAVESDASSIKQLNHRALSNVTGVCADLYDEDVFPRLYRQQGYFDLLVLDPPRTGLKNQSGLLLKKHRFKHIFYVSCDLATFNRDAKLLLEAGYKLKQIQPVDMSPHTPHIELLTHFVLG